jgi:hypothetical protein
MTPKVVAAGWGRTSPPGRTLWGRKLWHSAEPAQAELALCCTHNGYETTVWTAIG